MNGARVSASPSMSPVVHLGRGTALVPDEILATPRGVSRGMFRDLAALVLDRHLRRLVRIRQPLDLRAGHLLARMDESSGFLALGFARLSDYVTERLGLPSRRVQTLLALVRRLARLPRMADAFESGVVSLSQVRVLLRVATAANETEWIARARATTVRRLESEVRAVLADAGVATGGAAGSEERFSSDAAIDDAGIDSPTTDAAVDDDPAIDDDAATAGEFIAFDAPPAVRARWEEALEVARRSAGAGDPTWRSVELIVADYLAGVPNLDTLLAEMSDARIAGGHAADEHTTDEQAAGDPSGEQAPGTLAAGERDAAPSCPGDAPDANGVELFEEVLAGLASDPEYADPSIPADTPVVILPESVHSETSDSDFELDARLRELVRLRQDVSWNLGRLLRLFADRRLHRELGFMSFSRYCRERLGIGARRAWLLVGLERRLVDLPGIARAYRSGSLSWVKASALARVANEVSEDRWLRLAGSVTVRRLLEEVTLAESGPSPRAPLGLDAGGRVQFSTPTRVAIEVTEADMRARIRFWAPHEVASLWHEALAICRHRADRHLTDWECVGWILASFLETWSVRAGPACLAGIASSSAMA